jgi:DNA-binding LacI/PurR family transcriptional regulator
MSDVARLSGVSVSTVSRALSDSSLIPEQLKQKIREVAEENGYVVNAAARNLRLQTTKTIGLVLPMGHEENQKITDPFLLEMIGCLADEVFNKGYDLLLSKNPQPKEGWLKRLIASQRFDGLLVIGQSDQHDALNQIAATYAPLVVWGEHMKVQHYCTVGVNNFIGGQLATDHLLARGRSKIIFLGPPNVPEVESRYNGYAASMKSAGKKPLRIECHFGFNDARDTMRKLLKSKQKFDALFCASDVIAQGSMSALAEENISIPEKIAVCGYDDVSIAKSLNPPLTTIHQDLSLGAKFMVDLLFQRLGGDQTSSAIMPARLITRQST